MFESHITVDKISKKDFLSLCESLKVKPVIIKNDSGSEWTQQMMTAKFHKTQDFDKALSETKQIASHLPNVVRVKLEKIIGKDRIIPDHKYLEFHSKYEVTPANSLKFQSIVHNCGGHVAKNTVKGNNFMFATTRDRQSHINITKSLYEYLLVNTIIEAVVYDTNPSIDSNWECMECPLKSFKI